MINKNTVCIGHILLFVQVKGTVFVAHPPAILKYFTIMQVGRCLCHSVNMSSKHQTILAGYDFVFILSSRYDNTDSGCGINTE